MEVSELRALGHRVAADQDEALGCAEADPSLRDALAAHATGRPLRVRQRARLRVGLAAAAFVASALSIALVVFVSTRPLTFTVGVPARPGVVSEWVSAAVSREVPVTFSDGTRIVLAPEARGRVVQLAHRGAEFVIESGRAAISVVPNAKGDFRIRTGPFVVHVHGTRFTVDWDPARDAFTLALFEGHVTVSGCAFGAGRAVSPGETVHASCGEAKPLLDAAATKIEAAAPVIPPAPGAIGSQASSSQKTEPRPADAPESWLALAQQGLYARAYDVATTAGFARELRSRSAAEVLLLGDVARHVGRIAEARSAYVAARERSPGSDSAANAAFALGRLSFDANHDLGTAATWFETYLQERPGGPLSAAALGRLLEARMELREGDAARSVARRYLALYPSGPLAHEARKVAGTDE